MRIRRPTLDLGHDELERESTYVIVLGGKVTSADERAKLVGTWKLISFENEFQDGTERRSMMGPNPTGYLIFTPEGRIMSIVEAEGRKAQQTDEEAATAFRTMFAYTGTLQLNGDRWATTVDVAWNPAWHGTEQVRTFKLDRDRRGHVTLEGNSLRWQADRLQVRPIAAARIAAGRADHVGPDDLLPRREGLQRNAEARKLHRRGPARRV